MGRDYTAWIPPDNPDIWSIDFIIDRIKQQLLSEPIFDARLLEGQTTVDAIDAAYYSDLFSIFFNKWWQNKNVRTSDLEMAFDLLWIELLTNRKTRLGYDVIYQPNPKIRGPLLSFRRDCVEGLLHFYVWVALVDGEKQPRCYALNLVGIFPTNFYSRTQEAIGEQLSLF